MFFKLVLKFHFLFEASLFLKIVIILKIIL